MYVMPGLFTPTEKRDDCSVDGQMIYMDHAFTMEYEEIVQRLTTQIWIGEEGGSRFPVKAIWDTGATTSCISEKIAQKAGFRPVDSGVGVSAAAQLEIAYYMLNVHLSDDIIMRNIKTAGFPLLNHDADFLIGMDIISKGNLTIRNEGEKTVFNFSI